MGYSLAVGSWLAGWVDRVQSSAFGCTESMQVCSGPSVSQEYGAAGKVPPAHSAHRFKTPTCSQPTVLVFSDPDAGNRSIFASGWQVSTHRCGLRLHCGALIEHIV
ncbi:hypothetical protein BDW69DRAFT_155459 [Aspergillus filifer]